MLLYGERNAFPALYKCNVRSIYMTWTWTQIQWFQVIICSVMCHVTNSLNIVCTFYNKSAMRDARWYPNDLLYRLVSNLDANLLRSRFYLFLAQTNSCLYWKYVQLDPIPRADREYFLFILLHTRIGNWFTA